MSEDVMRASSVSLEYMEMQVRNSCHDSDREYAPHKLGHEPCCICGNTHVTVHLPPHSLLYQTKASCGLIQRHTPSVVHPDNVALSGSDSDE